MKQRSNLLRILLLVLMITLILNCKKEATKTLPAVVTSPPTKISTSSATAHGEVTSDGGAPVVERGICWNTSPNPDISNHSTSDGMGIGIYASTLTGLTISSTYYLRAYATNAIGTTYGNEITFKTPASQAETVSDIDGNVYHTVAIGSQIWMIENLKVTKYRNGDQIPVNTDYTKWDSLTTGARVTNTSIDGYVNTYGWFYNWYAVSDSRNICPTGWHVPSDAELTTLSNYLGGDEIAGGKLKESGASHWESPNTGATNESGFTALSGAFYLASPGWVSPGNFGMWWTATENNSLESWNCNLSNTGAGFYRVTNKKASGFSVRCLKD